MSDDVRVVTSTDEWARAEARVLAALPDLRPPLRWTALTGGQSNLTSRVVDAAGRTVVVRRPPRVRTGAAHDLERECTVLKALAESPVPVPGVLVHCPPDGEDGELYVMEWVAGTVLFSARDAEPMPGSARAAVGSSMVDALTALHNLDPETVGLGGLGRGTSYVERQIARWAKVWEASACDEAVEPLLSRIQHFLLAAVPRQQRVSVAHGDFGLHNCLVTAGGSVAAVVDWEIATLGDPLADLGYFVNSWAEEPEELPGYRAASSLDGFASRHELVERYAAGTGLDLSDLAFHRCFSYWKTAIIYQGVIARNSGGTSETSARIRAAFPARVVACLQRAATAADDVSTR